MSCQSAVGASWDHPVLLRPAARWYFFLNRSTFLCRLCFLQGIKRCKDTRTRSPDEVLRCTICKQRLSGDRFYPRHLSCIACQISVNALQRCGSGADRHHAKAAYSRMCEMHFNDLEADVPHIRDHVQAEAVKILAEDESQGSNPTKRRRVDCCEKGASPPCHGMSPAAHGSAGRLSGTHSRRRTQSTSAGTSTRLTEMLRRPKTRTWELDKLATLCWHILQEEEGTDTATDGRM